jgi:hypothetical protein
VCKQLVRCPIFYTWREPYGSHDATCRSSRSRRGREAARDPLRVSRFCIRS